MTIETSMFWFDEVRTKIYTSGYSLYYYDYSIKNCVLTVGELLSRFQSIHPGGVQPVIETIRTDNPLHPPTFFVLQYYWASLFGNSILASRSLSLL
ncbi:MAG: hypothetical protein K2Z81_07705, partial [Cyanobacteria bacterium]|nr:hypothetical protein [Cyanobacteriota bacterium]